MDILQILQYITEYYSILRISDNNINVYITDILRIYYGYPNLRIYYRYFGYITDIADIPCITDFGTITMFLYKRSFYETTKIFSQTEDLVSSFLYLLVKWFHIVVSTIRDNNFTMSVHSGKALFLLSEYLLIIITE